MRIDAVRFGVRTNKTIRKPASGPSMKLENEILKQSNQQAKIELVNGKLMKSANNFEKKDKNDRKR